MRILDPLERLNEEVKRRADVVGIFPNEASITRLIGAVLLEYNDEWLLQHRHMQVDGMAELTPPLTDAIQRNFHPGGLSNGHLKPHPDLHRLDGHHPAFANLEVYALLEAEGASYTIHLPANQVLQDKIEYLLKRPVGRPPHEMRRYYASFRYQAQSWDKPRHVVAKVEWHPDDLCPRVGFIVTNLARSAEGIVAFCNQRGTCKQHIKARTRLNGRGYHAVPSPPMPCVSSSMRWHTT